MSARIAPTLSALVVLAGLVLAACADPEGASPAAGRPATTTPPSTAAPASTVAPVTTTSGPGTTGTVPARTLPGELRGPRVVATGVILSGVEPGCLLLQPGGGEPYLLLGTSPLLREGARVQVVGVRIDNVVSYCQQGRPLRVLEVKPA